MTAPAPGKSYLSSPEAVTLHATFVKNVRELMVLRRWVHGTDRGNISGSVDLQRLSDASGVPYRTVQNLMTLSNQPSLVGAAAIARALGVNLDALLGMDPAWGYGELPSGQTVLECIDTSRHLPGMRVCRSCLDKWNNFQERKRALYEANRQAATAESDIREQERRANVRANGQDPDDVRR